MVGAIRDYCASGKGLLLWTHPGSQGWRPVGGLVLHGGLLEIGVKHKFLATTTPCSITFKPARNQCALGTLNQCIIDERRAHGVF
jgi:hypothetical protein